MDTHYDHSGNDTLMGSNGKDTLFGKGGRDVQFGSTDDDRMSGGSKADVFVYNSLFERDVVSDFVAGVDRLQLDHNQCTDFLSVIAHEVHLEADMLATFDAVATIKLRSVLLANWSDADFLFIYQEIRGTNRDTLAS